MKTRREDRRCIDNVGEGVGDEGDEPDENKTKAAIKAMVMRKTRERAKAMSENTKAEYQEDGCGTAGVKAPKALIVRLVLSWNEVAS